MRTHELKKEQLSNLVHFLIFFANWAVSHSFSSLKTDFFDFFKVFSYNIK